MNKETFIQRFSLSPRCDYEEGFIKRATKAFSQDRVLKPAAVMLTLVERNKALHLLFIKRAAHLRHHPSQISFPGGKVEPTDKDIIAAAIRETHEEIGVKVLRANVLGLLAPLPTISGYMIYPIIGFANADYQAKLDPNEVELLFEMPLRKLASTNALTHQFVQLKQSTYPIWAMHHDNHLIWGATAQILYALNHQLMMVEN